MKVLTSLTLSSFLDLQKNELRNATIQVLATPPSSPATGQIYYNSDANDGPVGLMVYNGTAWESVGSVDSLSGTAPISVSINDGVATISISAASGSAAGSMSSAHYTLVNNATDSNTASTLVKRDSSGNFTATTITANLTGTASNASQLNSQNASYYLDRSHHSGTQAASTISDFDTQVRTSRLDQMAVAGADVSLNSNKITNLATPTSSTDAATKGYVDSAIQGLDVHEAVRVATTANITLSGTQTIDGVSLSVGDRVLVKNQTTASQNGIYDVASSTWSRSADSDDNIELEPGTFVFVTEGTVYADTGWVLTTDGPITVGSTSINWIQFSGAGAYSGGDGLTLSGTEFSVNVDSSTIEINSDTLRVKDSGITSAKLATGSVDLGTNVVTGTLPVSAGGTGATTTAGVKSALGYVTRYTENIGNGSLTTITVTHGLGTREVQVSVWEVSSPYAMVITDVEATTTDSVTLRFASAPSSGQYKVVVIG